MINDYNEVKECVYKDEHYSVRDNGAIFRHKREGKRLRFDDERWTFGFKNSKTGYMLLGDHRVHIIVATAFLGERDSKKFVVDHIDTNRCNNRVENLRWFTRLENALNNEITRSKIIYICGSIEAFIENPNILRERLDQVKEPSLEWMRTVSPEEAKIAHENMKKFWEEQAQNPRTLNGGALNERIFQNQGVIQTESVVTDSNHNKTKESKHSLSNDEINELLNQLQSNSVGHNEKDGINLLNYRPSEDEWNNSQSVYQKKRYEVSSQPNDPSITKAKSPTTAWQKNWETLVCFPKCPILISGNPIEQYYDRLIIDEDYNSTKSSNGFIVETIIDKTYTDSNFILVLSCSREVIRLSKIYFDNGYFVHENLKTYQKHQADDAIEHFISEQGLKCTVEEYMLKRRFSESNLVKAKSPETAWQINWKTPTDFLCCPNTIEENPIEEYYNRIFIGEAYNSTNFYGSNEVQKVIDKAHAKGNTIIVLSCNPNSIKPYALCKIHYFEGKFIHESLGTFFEEDGGRKYFTLEQGLEWTGEDSFDDYC